MTIGDQVKNLEQEYDAAVALADSLATQCDALKSANAVLEKQLVLRTAALADTEARMAEALEMVDAVANAALSMLKVAKRPMGTPSAIATARVIADAAPLVPVLVTDDMLAVQPPASSFAGSLTGVIDPASVAMDAQPEPFASQVAGDIMAADNVVQSDSGDETEEKPVLVDTTPIKNAMAALAAEPEPVSVGPISAEPSPLWPNLDVEPEPSAIDRMRRGNSADLLPAPTLMRMPGPTLVAHNDSGLPVFLQRDTVFQRQGDAIFS